MLAGHDELRVGQRENSTRDVDGDTFQRRCIARPLNKSLRDNNLGGRPIWTNSATGSSAQRETYVDTR
jgi:hypothetical protein